jgi:signal transduction histidine kinase
MFTRYISSATVLMIFSFTVLTIIFTVCVSSLVTGNEKTRQVQAAEIISSSFGPEEIDALSEDTIAGIENIGKLVRSNITLVRVRDGKVLVDTGDYIMGVQSIPPNEMEYLKPGAWNSATWSERKVATYTHAIVNPNSGKSVALLLITYDLYPVKNFVAAFKRAFSLIAALMMVATFLIVYLGSRAMAQPLTDLAECARKFELGDFSARVHRWALRNDEIGQLAVSFNNMADSLEQGEQLRRGFIGSVSHELRTPMTTISGYIGGLLDGTIPEARRTECLQFVHSEVMRLSRMVSSLLELSRFQTGQMDIEPRPMDVVELSTQILLGMEPKVNERHLNVEIMVPDTPVTLMADPDSIAQIMTNLLDNAVKFCDEGGTITLSIMTKNDRGYVIVRNTGETIPPEDLPFIFDRFHKADASRSMDKSGLGLGLFLVKSMLAAHKEDIFVMSENGMTEFLFSLPLFFDDPYHDDMIVDA